MTHTDLPAGRRAFAPDELAAAWGVHPETIRRRLRTGKLAGFRIGEDWRIPISAIEAYEAEHSGAGSARPAARNTCFTRHEAPVAS